MLTDVVIGVIGVPKKKYPDISDTLKRDWLKIEYIFSKNLIAQFYATTKLKKY